MVHIKAIMSDVNYSVCTTPRTGDISTFYYVQAIIGNQTNMDYHTNMDYSHHWSEPSGIMVHCNVSTPYYLFANGLLH